LRSQGGDQSDSVSKYERFEAMDQEPPKEASAKSLRFVSGILSVCHNPLCRSDFRAKRKDQRFCGPTCKEAFFKVKYALLTLAPYFNVDPGEGMEGVN